MYINMAVSVKCNGEICEKAQKRIEMKSPCRLMGSGSDKVLSEFSDDDSRRRKKERKKPEMPIYRPGMGLQHKNNLTKDEAAKTSADSGLSERETISLKQPRSLNPEKLNQNVVVSVIKDSKEADKNGSSKKNTKNRRPDIEVYTPKPRISASLKGITEPELDSDPKCGKEGRQPEHLSKESSPIPEKPSQVQNDMASSKKDVNKNQPEVKLEVEKKPSNKFLEVNGNGIERNSFLAEKPLDWYARSSPESVIEDGVPIVVKSTVVVNSNIQRGYRSMTPDNCRTDRYGNDASRSSASRSHYRDKTEEPKSRTFNKHENMCDTFQKTDERKRRNSLDLNKNSTRFCSYSSRTPNHNQKKNESASEQPDSSSEKNRSKTLYVVNSNYVSETEKVSKRNRDEVLDRPRERRTSEKSDYSHSTNGSSTPESRERTQRKNRQEKLDNLPPRFQKLHLANSSNNSNNNNNKPAVSAQSVAVPVASPGKSDGIRGGGILRIPAESFNSDCEPVTIETPKPVVHPPFHFPSAPPQFIHKQLFNPKNPSAPEIVNIPTTVNMQHYPPRSLSPEYMHRNDHYPPPMYMHSPRSPSDGFIPPPQPVLNGPAVIRNPYQFQNGEFPPLIDVPRNTSPLCCSVGGVSPPMLQGDSLRPPIGPVIQPPVCATTFLQQAEAEKKRLKPIVEKNLKEISMLERELNSLMSKGYSSSNLAAMRQCRWKLQLRYENIILADPRYCAEKNTEQQLWKIGYHQIIEAMRKDLEEKSDNQELQENLLNLIHEGTVFYECLLEKQQETFGFSLSKILDMEDPSNLALYDSLRLVLISCQKTLIYLGDLARYKEQANATSNYGKARSWYMKAQQLVPKNGRPYHQLAVLALCTRRKLDAVYYFMRSLAASNPFLSAREYLLTLFEDSKKKYEQYEKKRQEDIVSEQVIAMKLGERCEVWVKPDGSSTQQDSLFDDGKKSQDFTKLSDAELNKRFITSFLHAHGKLYTKVGMDTFHDTVSQMLKEFHHLLSRTPFPLESLRLLQLTTINMFAVGNVSDKDPSYNDHVSSSMMAHALSISQAMMALIMQRCCMLHKEHILSSKYPQQVFSDDMERLVPTIKVWTDWISCQRPLWSRFPLPSSYSYNWFDLDVWASFADLLTVLKDIDTSTPKLVFEKQEGLEALILEEDTILAGFVPLLAAPREACYVQPPFDKSRAKDILRLSKIQFFGDYLCGIPTPYLEFDVQCKRFRSLVFSSSSESDLNKSASELWDSSKEDSFGDETGDSDDMLLQSSPDAEGNSEIRLLWSRKEALCKAKARQEKFNARMQAVIQKNQLQNPIVLQIQPKFLVPDTNCFIDYLPQLRDVLAIGTFSLIVPLIVINELDGLACGTKENPHTTPEHANKVTAQSREAVMFLEKEFAARNPHLRAITSKGSVLDTISFRAEEIGYRKVGTNDDFILSCCLYYCKDRPEMYMPKKPGDPVKLERDVVLLTDDRNLRVKALTRNVPARELLSFLQWVNS